VLPHLITSGVPHFVSNRTIIDVEKWNNSKFIGGHFGLSPLDYMDSDTKVFTVIRNPVDRFISYFKYTTGLVRAGQEASDKLERWLYGDQSNTQANLQTKFLLGKTNINEFNKNFNYFQKNVDNAWYLEEISGGVEKAISNLDKFYAYSLENLNLFKEDMNKALEKEFLFKPFKGVNDSANRSPEIGLSLTKKQIARIEELNEMDMILYEHVSKSKKRY
jgi:hypothetical protein